jgi:hypothetical protein
MVWIADGLWAWPRGGRNTTVDRIERALLNASRESRDISEIVYRGKFYGYAQERDSRGLVKQLFLVIMLNNN